MNLLYQLLVAVIFGGLLYYIVSLLPLPPPFKNIALVVVLCAMLLWLLARLGPAAGLH